jgi:hypothetical protein
MTSSLVLRSATSADSAELQRLAALDSARPLEGDVLLAYAGGELRAALSVDSGRAVADPFWPTADLVALLHAAAGEKPRRRLRPRVTRVRRKTVLA